MNRKRLQGPPTTSLLLRGTAIFGTTVVLLLAALLLKPRFLGIPFVIVFGVGGFGIYLAFCLYVIRFQQADRAKVATFIVASLTYLSNILIAFAYSYRLIGLVVAGSVVNDPWTCLYFSVITLTTVGYGDVIPTPSARACAAIEALIGYVFMAVFIATLLHIFNIYRGPDDSPGL